MTMAYDIIVIGGGPGGYVAAIRAAQLGFKTAVVEREHLGGICLNWGCIPTKALLRSAEILHYAEHASAYGLKLEGKVTPDPAAVVARSRKVSQQLNGGVAFLLKKNKVDVIWGEAVIPKVGEVKVTATKKPIVQPQNPIPKGVLGRGHIPGQAHHRRHRRPPARAAGHRAGRQADLDLFRGDEARKIPEVAARHGLRRDRHRIRVLLPPDGRRRDGRRSAAAGHAGGRRRDRQGRAEALRKARSQDHALDQGDEGREVSRQHYRDGRGRQGQDADDHCRAHDFGGRRRRQYRESRAGSARREDRSRLRRHRRLRPHQCAGHLRHRRCRRPADARAQGRARGRDLRRDDQGPAHAPHGKDDDSGLHLLQSAGGFGRPDRGEGQGRGLRGQGRPLQLSPATARRLRSASPTA